MAKHEIRVWEIGEDTFVSDEEGQEYKVQGYGCMKHFDLGLDPRIDLTAPIYEQVLHLAAEDKKAEELEEEQRKRAAA